MVLWLIGLTLFLAVACALLIVFLFVFKYPNKSLSSKNALETPLVTMKDVGLIDAVVTWVNTKDPEWKKLKDFAHIGTNADNPERWADKLTKPDTELELCLELMLKNMPYLRKVHIVTMRPQVPPCLKHNPRLEKEFKKKRIVIMHHDEIFEEPWKRTHTFNSSGIETYLHNIPDLQEQFVYFNDDMYVTSYMDPRHLFQFGKAVVYGTPRWFPISDPTKCPEKDKYYCASKRSKNIIMGEYGVYFTPLHQFKCLTKHMLQSGADKYQEYVYTTRDHPIRHTDDILFLDMCINMGIHEGYAVIGHGRYMKHLVMSATQPFFTRSILAQARSLHAMCINNCNSTKCQNLLATIRKTLDV